MVDESAQQQAGLEVGRSIGTMLATSALNAALVEAGLIPAGYAAQHIRSMSDAIDTAHPDQSVAVKTVKLGLEIAAKMVSPDRPDDSPPDWLRGVIDGGKSTEKE